MSGDDDGLGELRIRFENLYIIVRTVKGGWRIEITDALGIEPPPMKREDALRHLLRLLSALRRYVYRLLGGKP